MSSLLGVKKNGKLQPFVGGEVVRFDDNYIAEIYVRKNGATFLVWQYDIQVPTFEITTDVTPKQPGSDYFLTNLATLTLVGTIIDTESGVAWLKCNDVDIPFDPVTGLWQYTIPLTVGKSSYRFTYSDKAGCTGVTDINVERINRNTSKFKTIAEVGRDYGWYWTAGYSHWNVRTDTYGDAFNYEESQHDGVHSQSAEIWRQIEPRFSKAVFSTQVYMASTTSAEIYRADGTSVWHHDGSRTSTVNLAANGWNDGNYWACARANFVMFGAGVGSCNSSITMS